MDKFLSWFAWTWLTCVIGANVMIIALLLNSAPTIWQGAMRVQAVYSPLNIANCIFEVIAFSPAPLALWWRDRLRGRHESLTNLCSHK